MAEIQINLSGKNGLTDLFAGDTDRLTPDPHLRISTGKEMMASGVFNPYLRDGYLSPTTTTSVSLTHGSTPTSEFRSVEYDHSAGEVILTDDTDSIYKLTSLTDTSTELVTALGVSNGFGDYGYTALYDSQIYSLNGERKLFVVGESVPYGGTITDYGTTTGTSSAVGTFAINPSGVTQPSVVYSTRQFDAAPGTSDSLSVTVPSGTDQVLFVVAFWSNDYNAAYLYNTNTSSEMDRMFKRSVSPSTIAAYTVNPSAGTYNIEIAGPSGGFTNLTMMAFVTDNTDQTYPVGDDVDAITGPLLSSRMEYVNENQAHVVAMYSNGDITLNEDYGEQEGDSQAWGYDLLATNYDVPASGLQIGVLDLPVSTMSSSYETWLSSKASGSFYQEVPGDYAFMRNADNGYSYVFSGNSVHKIDGGLTGGTDGTITKNVLLFPDNFRITDSIDYRSNLYIAVHQFPATVLSTSLNNYGGVCGVYIWNRISTQFVSSDFIELPGVREIKKIYASPDGVVKLLVINSNGLTELRQFGYNDSGGVVFPVAKRLGIGAYPQTPDGHALAGDKASWLANDGYVYCEKGNAVTRLHVVDVPGNTTATVANNIESGILFYGSGSETAGSGYRSNKQGMLLSYTDTSTIFNEKIYPFDLTTGSDASQTPHQGDVYTEVMYIPVTSIVRRVRIYNAPVSSTGTDVIATVKLYFNQSTDPTMPNGMTKSVTLKEAKRGYIDFNISKSYVHAIQLEIEWATGTPIGDDMYMPSVAIISTEETDVKTPDSE